MIVPHHHGQGPNRYACTAACGRPVRFKHTSDGAPFVRCLRHGYVELTDDQYNHQMSRLNDRWVCPKCGEIAHWAGVGNYE